MLKDRIEDSLTFDDVLLLPGYSKVLPSEVSVKSRITQTLECNIPLISAAMDTVTEHQTAICMAQEGGIGIIHKNMTAEDQATQVKMVKRSESGMISDPITVEPEEPLQNALDLMEQYRISGVPVTKGRELVGILTNRDLRFETNFEQPVSALMTKGRERLITVATGIEMEEAKHLLHKHRIEKLLVVSEKFELVGLITIKDIEKARKFPDSNKDDLGRLRVGAALGTSADLLSRAETLIKAGVDVVVLDTAHGHSQGVLDSILKLRSTYPELQIIGGNIATGDAADALVKAGANAVKVGIGPGSICTTRLVAGIGVPQLSAILDVKKGMGKSKTTLIADGGIKFSGDIAKALAAGADAVMIGSLFAGTDQAPGRIIKRGGKLFKSFRGMGSVGAMNKGSADRYFQKKQKDSSKYVPEGVEGLAKYKGKVDKVVFKLVGGLRSSMGYLGSKQIKYLRYKPQFVKITKAGFYESMVHNVDIVKSDSKY